LLGLFLYPQANRLTGYLKSSAARLGFFVPASKPRQRV